MTTRRTFLQAALGAAAAGAAPSAPPPNIITILCDDLGYGDLGCYGNRIIHTPNIDAMAAAGARFTDFYAASPVCSPTRAALMTGHYPQRYGIHGADLPEHTLRFTVPGSAVTVTEVLKGAGYYTAHVGKWHLGEPPHTVEPRQQGLDHFFGSFGGRPSSPWIKYSRSMDPEIIVNEERPVVHKGHITEILTGEAERVIRERARGGPFYLNLWHNAPHEPLAPLPHAKKLYRWWNAAEQTYFQTVTDMDAGVGRIFQVLRETGLDRNTLVVFTSDNGPEAHSHPFSTGSAGPLKGMKTSLWEGGIRVPGIVWWPGRVAAGAVCRAPATVLDLFPTYCAAARVKPPAGMRLDGSENLVDLAGAKAYAGRSLFFEYHQGQRGAADSSLPMALRRGRWKLFADHEFSRTELYDLESDPGEQRNAAAANPEVVAAMLPELRKWWAQFGDVDLHPKNSLIPAPSREELDQRYYRN